MKFQPAKRVEKALIRFGFSAVRASCGRNGDVELTGTAANQNDRALACAVVRLWLDDPDHHE